MIRLDAATVLLQWATGGLFFLWFTTRKHEMGAGYGWLMRSTFLLLASGAAAAGFYSDVIIVREVAAIGCALAALLTLKRKNAQWDLLAPAVGIVGVIAGAIDAANGAGGIAVNLLRVLVGTAFLGAVSDAMLLGHWYLVQPGLPRSILSELVTALRWITPFEIVVMLLPTGMFSVFSGSVDDGWGGMLGWFWIACAISTVILTEVTRAALREKFYSAVMAATGLLYLAILTAFGTDLVARAVLA
ncbi:unannotated protein [freshwater metagenome]|uniref:Unannotated protein n=1 Tax=freshwater metagenome TaxID=449393 RepID=A0A6J6HVZ9_9ZZZZ|nr:hypothetical protein [Actinomycetota bacterium]